MSTSGRAPLALLVFLGAAGAVLVALPWLSWPAPMSLPPVIEQGTPGHDRLVHVAREVDRVCAEGDLDALRSLVTPAHLERIDAWMREAGRGLDPAALREQRFLVGDLDALPFLCGASGESVAVLVYFRSRSALEAGATRGSLFALRFWWDGYSFLLDGKSSQTLAPEDDRAARAREWAEQLLGRGER